LANLRCIKNQLKKLQIIKIATFFILKYFYWFTFKLPPVATVIAAPGLIVMLLQFANTPLAITGLLGLPEGITTSLVAVGTMPDDQLAPFVQDVLELPVHV